MNIIIHGPPVPKPRMTQRDKWKQRPCVMEFFVWRDVVQATVNGRLDDHTRLRVEFFLPFPRSMTKKHRADLLATPHHQKPDLDNLVKALMDCLFVEDCQVSSLCAEKFWDDGHGPRTVILL